MEVHAEVSTAENGEVKITATIDGHSITVTEGSLRRHLKLDDQDGTSSIPNSEIFEQLALMGYHTNSDKLTFQKGAFSPQWRIGVLEDDLKKIKKTYSSAYTKLILRVKKLESQIKTGKARRKARVVLSDDEVLEDDSSKQGGIMLIRGYQEKSITETKLFIQEGDQTEVIQAQEGVMKIIAVQRKFVPMDLEHGTEKMKSPEKSPEKMKSAEKMEEDDVAKETRVKRKKYIPRKSTRKRQKAIHMLTEKKYPLSQELLSKMLSKKLEVDLESSQALNSKVH
ncbi:hypothetical protein Tco_0855507 [Tanacetum coccineum]